jgi:hydrogenase maturation factor HypF (carbamoyltransferase family)
VLARDFLSPPPRVRLSRLRNRRLKQRLDRAIAHLTFSRSRLGRRWRVQALLSEIDTAMAAFIARLETEKPVLARIMQVSNRDDG